MFSIPFVNGPDVSVRLRQVEERPGFIEWGFNPWTGEKHAVFEQIMEHRFDEVQH